MWGKDCFYIFFMFTPNTQFFANLFSELMNVIKISYLPRDSNEYTYTANQNPGCLSIFSVIFGIFRFHSIQDL